MMFRLTAEKVSSWQCVLQSQRVNIIVGVGIIFFIIVALFNLEIL